jgi:hypothetical protein
VLPIGGLKEKALGALRAGIKTVIIPAKNKKELDEIPSAIKRKLKFVAVHNMDEVLDLALHGTGGKESRRFDGFPHQRRKSANEGMHILAVDTATEVCGVAVAADGDVLAALAVSPGPDPHQGAHGRHPRGP